MSIDRRQWPWALFVLLASSVAAIFYAANFHPGWLPIRVPLPAFLGPVPAVRQSAGGTMLGLIFGALALLIFLFASALGIRKKWRRLPIGRVEHWLRAHLWLTVLTLPLVAFHCDFRTGREHTLWLLVLYEIVMVSGLLGAALQHFLPQRMKERLPREVVFETIPALRSDLQQAAQRLRAAIVERDRLPVSAPAHRGEEGATERAGDHESAQVLLQCLDDHCERYLAADRRARHHLSDERVAQDVFRMVRLNVLPRWREEVDQIETWCRDRRTMDLQAKYQHWLHGWLLVHVPASFALLVFALWHAWIAVRFLVLQP